MKNEAAIKNNWRAIHLRQKRFAAGGKADICFNCGVKLCKITGTMWCWECDQIPLYKRDGYYYEQEQKKC
jgi:hypothetical protein